jgi:hypothetical protein
MKNLFLSSSLILALSINMSAVDCQRTVKANSAKEMKIEITISKDQYQGFARLAEYLPAGSVVKYAKSEGGTFIVQDNKLKFIWLALPQQNTITATYIISMETLKEGNYGINGKFSYVDGNETKEYDIPVSSFTINNNQIASIGAATVDPNLLNVNPSIDKTKADTKVSKLTYSLQMLSSKDKLPTTYFADKYHVTEKVKVETINGLNKYMLGEFKSVDEASAYRATLTQKGCKDAFIVGYLNDKRITLDDAKKLAAGK